MWTLHLLGNHSEIQQKAYEEIISIFGEDTRQRSEYYLREMKYVDCCIKEALRLYPPVSLFAR
ncbi:CYP4-like protein, partial [Leptotrombidium deliense]